MRKTLEFLGRVCIITFIILLLAKTRISGQGVLINILFAGLMLWVIIPTIEIYQESQTKKEVGK